MIQATADSGHSSEVRLLNNPLMLPGGMVVKNCLPMQEVLEMRVQSLGQEDPLEEEMATHSSILAWEVPWTEEPGSLQSMGPTWKELDPTEHAHTHVF